MEYKRQASGYLLHVTIPASHSFISTTRHFLDTSYSVHAAKLNVAIHQYHKKPIKMFGILRPGSPERERSHAAATASPPPPRSLAPMPSSVFRSREDLLEGCKDWSATQGYAIVIARSRFNRLWLKCDRGGTYENRRNLTPDQRKRKRGDSRLLGCPFKMIAACRKDGSWSVDTEIPEHNHGPSEDMSAHPTMRRMTDQQLQKVHDMADSGKSPAETLDELKSMWPDIKVLTRDIYNARKKYKTLRDEAEAAAGVDRDQPYQDPNELGFQGPSPNGRWAWVPDGEEVTNKKLKRKRKSTPAPQPSTPSTLDPQLQTPNLSRNSDPPVSAGHEQQNESANLPDPAEQLRGAAQQAYDRVNAKSNVLQRVPEVNGIGAQLGYFRTYPNSSATLPPYPPPPETERHPFAPIPRLPLQQAAAPIATMSSAPGSENPSALTHPPGEPKAQVLMTRIERMEKEQADQKNMLAQILGAVQEFRGSPGSEARA